MRNATLAAAALLLPVAAFANGYAVPNLNARDMGMGDGLTAAQTGPGAVYANPAALAGQTGFAALATGSLIDFRSTWTDAAGGTGGSVGMTPKAVFPPVLALTYGAKAGDMAYGLGLGFDVPFGGYVFWPANWRGAGQDQYVDRKTYAVRLSGGIQPIPMLKVGGGLVYYRTTSHLAQAIDYLGGTGGAELGVAGGKLSYALAAEATPLKDVPLTLGLNYTHKANQTLTGRVHFDIADSLRPSAAAYDQGVTTNLPVPNVLQLGAAFRVLPELLVAAQYEFFRWIEYRQDVFSGDLGANVQVQHNWHNGHVMRVGAEYGLAAALPGLRLRGGVERDFAPQPADTVSPSLPNTHNWTVTAGAGYDMGSGVSLDAAYLHAFFEDITATGNAFPGSYATRANIFSVSLTYRLGEPAKDTAAGGNPTPKM